MLFGVFFDDFVTLVNDANVGCRIGVCCAAIIFLYADDIILLAPSVHACITELNFLDIAINTTKSSCLRYGSRYKNDCACVTVSGSAITWATSARYLGIYLEVSAKFKCSSVTIKAKFFRAFNCIFGRLDVMHQKKFYLP